MLIYQLHLSRIQVPLPSLPAPHLESLCSGCAMVLMVGQVKLTEGKSPEAFRAFGCRVVCFAELDGPLLQEVRPDLVVSPLVGERFDAIDVAVRLVELGFSGPYRAFSGPLPRPGLIRSEVRSAAPGLDFDLLIVSHGPDRPD